MPLYKPRTVGIVKFVNYSLSTPVQVEHFARYLKHFSRTDERYIIAHYLTPNNIRHGIEVIEKRWQPRGTRSFKQGIISFGKSIDELPPEQAVDVMRETLQFFDSYPWVAAIHVNKPSHIHGHFMLGTTNIRSGRKLSQSPKDLYSFKDHYNSVARQHNLPLIPLAANKLPVIEGRQQELKESIQMVRGYRTVEQNRSYYDDSNNFDLCFDKPYTDMITPYTASTASPMSIEQDILPLVFDAYRSDFQTFFMLGFNKGGKYNGTI